MTANIINKFSFRKGKNSKTFDSIVYVSFVVFSFVSFVFCSISDSDVFSYLFLLPLLFGLVCLLFRNCFSDLKNHPVRFIILFLYFVRNTITPLCMALSNYESLMVTFSSSDVVKTVILLTYETIFSFVLINYKVRRLYRKTIARKESPVLSIKGNKLFKWAVIIISIFMAVCFVLVPDIQNSYKNMWTTSSNELITTFSTIQDYSAGSFQRILYAFFCFFFTPMLMIWLSIGITLVRKYIGDNKIGALLSVIIAFISTFFVSETSLLTVFTIVILLFYTMTIFKKTGKFVILSFGITLMVVFVAMIGMRMSTDIYGSVSFFGGLAKTLNAYVPGVYNVSGLWGVDVPSKFATLYWDIYSGIPLRSLIPALFSGERLSNYFNYHIGSTIQILPLIGQSYFYLYFFAPIVPCSFISLALYFERKMKETSSCFKYLSFFASGVIVGSALLIYDLTIIVAFSTRIVVPLIVLAYFDKKRKYR